MSCIFNTRPSQPKHPFIWDAETVLAFLRKLPGNDLLSAKLFTLKVSMLLALLPASRVSEVTNLRVDYLTKHSSVYTYAVPHLTRACETTVWSFTTSQVTANSVYARQSMSILKGIMFGGLGKANFWSAILNHINQHCTNNEVFH